MIHFGIVERYLDDKGYGFIRSQIDGKSYFAHVSEIQDATLCRGYRVAFGVEVNERNGKKNATNVIVVEIPSAGR